MSEDISSSKHNEKISVQTLVEVLSAFSEKQSKTTTSTASISSGKSNEVFTIDLKELFVSCLSSWKWFLLSVLLFLSVGVLYILKTPPVYSRSATLLIKEDDKGKSTFHSEADIFENVGLITSNVNIHNELEFLKSPSVMYEVVRRLNLDMQYFRDDIFYDKILYGTSLPIEVKILEQDYESNFSFMVTLHPGGNIQLGNFSLQGEEITSITDLTVALNDTITTPIGRICLYTGVNYTGTEDMSIHVIHNKTSQCTQACLNNLVAGNTDEKTSIITLTYQDFSIQRAEDIINTLISVYNENWVKDRNQIAVSTSQFINDRLNVIEQELGNVDNNISSYKSEHLVPDVQAASNMYVAQANNAKAEIKDLNNQLYMTRYIWSFITDDNNQFKLLPAGVGISNANIENLISEYNTKLLQRNSTLSKSSVSNPLVMEMDKTLLAMRRSIILSIDSQIDALNVQLRNLRKEEQQSTQSIASNPSQAKYLLSVERQQKVKEALYLFLLQKREENELSQAFTAYNTRIVTPPMGSLSPISPKKMQVMLVALLLGLMLPAGVIFVYQITETTVQCRDDLKDVTIPFIGEIPQHSQPRSKKRFFKKSKASPDDSKQIVVKSGCRDIINEAFRVLCSNIDFMKGPDTDRKVYMVTSLNPGSGKSFLTINMAACFAVKKKKILVIDGDMRHGSVSTYISSPKTGLSDYLDGRVTKLDDIIYTHDDYPSLDIIPVGTIPPNPTELLENGMFATLISTLRDKYDIIFIDCTPIDIVADAQVTEKYSDGTIFVVRAGLLERAMLPYVEKIYGEKHYKNLALVLNGTEIFSGYYRSRYGYRYGYKYGYKYGYHRYGYKYGYSYYHQES